MEIGEEERVGDGVTGMVYMGVLLLCFWLLDGSVRINVMINDCVSLPPIVVNSRQVAVLKNNKTVMFYNQLIGPLGLVV